MNLIYAIMYNTTMYDDIAKHKDMFYQNYLYFC